MEYIERMLNEDLDETTEDYVMKEFLYTLQISTVFGYARGKWVYVMVFHKLLFLLIIILTMPQLILTIIGLMEFHLSFAAQALFVLTGDVMCITIITTINRRKSIQLFKLLKSNFYDYGESFDTSECQKWCRELEKHKRGFQKFIIVLILIMILEALFGNTVFDALQNFKMEEDYINDVYMKTPFPLWFPFKATNTLLFLTCVIYELSAGIVILSNICSFSFLMIIPLLMLVLEFKILNLSVEKLEERAMNLFKIKNPDFLLKPSKGLSNDADFLKMYNYCMKQNIEHHNILIRAIRYFKQMISKSLFVVLINLTLSIACALLVLVKGEKRLGPQVFSALLLTLQMILLLVVCLLGQELQNKSEQFSSSFYQNTNWIEYPQSLKKSMMIIQENSKKHQSIQAGGITTINATVIASIINSSYSYFNLIHAMNGNK